MTHLGLCDLTGKTRVGVALEEALVNAMYHGNLEVSSDLRRDGDEPFYRRIESAAARRLIGADKSTVPRLSGAEAVFVVRDEGPGFDPALLPDPTDPANLGEAGGRGLLLIRAFMDEATFNAAGNEVTLVKPRPCLSDPILCVRPGVDRRRERKEQPENDPPVAHAPVLGRSKLIGVYFSPVAAAQSPAPAFNSKPSEKMTVRGLSAPL